MQRQRRHPPGHYEQEHTAFQEWIPARGEKAADVAERGQDTPGDGGRENAEENWARAHC
jgi:hypothetical protein